MIIIVLCKSLPTIEGFEDGKKICNLKNINIRNNNIYDDFYVDLYDQLVYSSHKNDYEIKQLQDK